MNFDSQIPEISADPDCSGVRVDECGEELVMLHSGERIHIAAAYHALGYPAASPEIWVRTGTFGALRYAAASLPTKFSLLVWDGLRALETQREIRRRLDQSISDLSLTPSERQNFIERYVSPIPASEEEYMKAPPPHLTGGAIDVSLCDDRGRPLDLGAAFDQYNEVAWLTFYERVSRSDKLTAADEDRRRLRRILYWAMSSAGFAPYIWEFWHYEYRTRRSAAFHGRTVADYGPALPWSVENTNVA
jgi:D-alanyl-D-alanine dipeptidase